MKKKLNISIILLLICLGGLIETQATKTINVRDKNNNDHYYELQDIRKLTFHQIISISIKQTGLQAVIYYLIFVI